MTKQHIHIMDATTLEIRDRSATTLLRVKHDDSALTKVTVTNAPIANAREKGLFWPIDNADLARLGVAIGKNTKLQGMNFFNDDDDPNAMDGMGGDAFFEGIKRNSSIRYLHLMNIDISQGIGRGLLNEFVANNNNFESLALSKFGQLQVLQNGWAGVFASALSRCKNLIEVVLYGCDIDDSILEVIVSGIRGLHRLEMLKLGENNLLLNNSPESNFGRPGREALASLLQDPNCKISELVLVNNNINVEYAAVLANGLKGNSKVEKLDLSSSNLTLTDTPNSITDNGWAAFTRVLCNASSVNDTYLSNHTLNYLGKPRAEVEEDGTWATVAHVSLPANLSSILELNRGTDKKCVATQKIFLRHLHLDMSPLLEWDLKVLPVAVSWFHKAR